ncbi:MAG: type II toxin-antitoxin system RelE/ParE family toxin [Faecalibacterium sp.]
MNIVKTKGFENIYEVDYFRKEFKAITDEKWKLSEPFPRYQKWLIGRLAVLDKNPQEALHSNHFEKLNADPTIYAIRYPKSKLNPRVLYVCVEDKNIILLTAFKEKSSSDYANAISVAQSRWKLLND